MGIGNLAIFCNNWILKYHRFFKSLNGPGAAWARRPSSSLGWEGYFVKHSSLTHKHRNYWNSSGSIEAYRRSTFDDKSDVEYSTTVGRLIGILTTQLRAAFEISELARRHSNKIFNGLVYGYYPYWSELYNTSFASISLIIFRQGYGHVCSNYEQRSKNDYKKI